MKSEDTNKSTSSPASADGRSRSDSQDGGIPDLFGAPVAPVPRSPSPARKRSARRALAICLCGALDELASQYARLAATHGLPTPATYGRRYGGSQPSAALNESLVNRLRERLPKHGSPEFRHRWESSATVLGLPSYQLRALGRRTGDSDSGGMLGAWPTPQNRETGGGEYRDSDKILARWKKGHQHNLSEAAKLAAWPSPRANKWGAPDSHGKTPKPMANWPTPRSTDANKGVRSDKGAVRENMRTKGPDLCTMAKLATWATPTANDDNKSVETHLAMKPRMGERDGTGAKRTAITSLQVQAKTALASGPTTTPSHAATDGTTGRKNTGALRPGHSLWLQGFPATWLDCGQSGTPSSPSSPPSSSKP